MKIMKKLLICIALVVAAPIAFACDYPAPPNELPDGATSSKDDMLSGVKMISDYQESMGTYLECIEADEIVAIQALADDDEDGKSQRKEMFDKKYNAAVDEQTKAVEQFNAEIRAYKENSN
jgi:hypothetical protein